jgi:tripartite-type tricarboxylate transporter receptor subunit TctC
MNLNSRFKRALGGLVCGLLVSGLGGTVAWAQNAWPSKPVKVTVPYAAGGTADLLGRLVSEQLTGVYKQNFYTENRPGAGGTVGSLAVSKAPADGYTLLVSGIGSHVIGPAMAATGFDPLHDFSHIAVLGGPPTVLVVPADLPVKDLKEFLAYAGGRKQGLSWGSPGQGTHGHLIGELFISATQVKDFVHVGYKGGAPAMVDLMGGHIQAAFVTYSAAHAHIRSGKVRALATSAMRRMPELKEVPTFAELGYPELTASTWFALSGPKGLSIEWVDQLNKAVRRALLHPNMRKILAAEGIESYDFGPVEVRHFLEVETLRWGQLIRTLDKDTVLLK